MLERNNYDWLRSDEERELDALIAKYPDKTGSYRVGEFGKDCVYYLDENGVEISSGVLDWDQAAFVTLATPVCLIGHWIEEFHPELKEDPAVRAILVRNSIISSIHGEDENPLDPAVIQVLRDYQQLQDDEKVATWDQIPSRLAELYG